MTPSDIVRFRQQLHILCQQYHVRLHTERIMYNERTKTPAKYHFELTAEVEQETVDLIETRGKYRG